MTEPRTETVELNGQPFFIRHWGDESLPKLLLLHGFPEYGGAWQDLATLLSKRFHCIAPDQRGYGQSWTPEGKDHYATGVLAGDMLALVEEYAPVDAKGAQKMHVLGHDWGSAVAYYMSIAAPHRVETLTILNGAHYVTFQRALILDAAQAAASAYIHKLKAEGSEKDFAKDDFAKLFRLITYRTDSSWLDDAQKEAFKTEWSRPGRLRAMIDWYRKSKLKVPLKGEPLPEMPDFGDLAQFIVTVPHLLVWGKNDPALLPVTTKGLEDFAPDLTREVIDDAGHWLHHQRPKEVADKIFAWFDDLDKRAATA